MPRKAREKKPGAVYHVLMRGQDGKALFRAENDYQYFITRLGNCLEGCDLELFGFCLLPDHAHLIVRENRDDMADFFRRLATAYACHFNLKHKRAGHVFRGRYVTQILEGNDQPGLALYAMLTEPERAGLCDDYSGYPWSSVNAENGEPGLITGAPLPSPAVLPPEETLAGLLAEPSREKKPLTDKQAEKIMKKVAHAKKLMELPIMSRKLRNAWLRRLRREGMSVTQISRYTGLGRNIVSRACSQKSAEKSEES